MKKTFTKTTALFMAIMMLLGSAAAGAGGFAQALDTLSVRASAAGTEYTDTAQGLKFTADSAIVITGYTDNLRVGANGSYTIPTKASNGTTEYTVTQIGSGAFNGCTKIKNLTIPEGITYIGSSAFKSCTSLQTVNYNSNSCELYDTT
ncbi:MAG: leucine-rich repeat protein, partial [Clostridia bacterium]|nr:leucine-rich repeat protein [Clostridia bacterium]